MDYDVIVVGGGSAAMAAAVSAVRHGAGRVLVLEKAPLPESGGNARLSHTGFRLPHRGLDEVAQFLPDLTDAERRRLDIEPYTPDEFLADIARLSNGGADVSMSRILAYGANEALHWMREMGVRWSLNTPLRSEDGRLHFEPGMPLQAGVGPGGGVSQLQDWLRIAEGLGVEIRYEAAVVGLERGDAGNPLPAVLVADGRAGTEADASPQRLRARDIVLASGGFQASAELRSKYLGPAARTMVVRGSRHDTGEVIEAALALGAAPSGDWRGANMTPVDAPPGAIQVGNHANRYSYQYGITVNLRGQRFFDEGEAVHSYTYARCGWYITRQPEGRAFQLFDARAFPYLKHYAYDYATPAVADDVAELGRLLGLPAGALERTVAEFNASVPDESRFDPTREDGVATHGLPVPKSNWARRLQQPPFYGYPVTAGITFTYGGLRVDEHARILDAAGDPIEGFYASGDILGIFRHNYPSGSGQTRNAVFSLAAGRHIAHRHSTG